MYKISKIFAYNFNFNTCTMEKIFERDIDSKYFAEGLTIVKTSTPGLFNAY